MEKKAVVDLDITPVVEDEQKEACKHGTCGCKAAEEKKIDVLDDDATKRLAEKYASATK